MNFDELKEKIENKVFTIDTSDCAGLPANQLTPDSSVAFKFKALIGAHQALEVYIKEKTEAGETIPAEVTAFATEVFNRKDSLGYSMEELICATEKGMK